MVEQRLGDAGGAAAMAGRHEHLTQRALTLADILERDRADDQAVLLRDPEAAGAGQVEAGYVGEVRLVRCGDGDAIFVALNAKDQVENARLVGGGEGADQGQGAGLPGSGSE